MCELLRYSNGRRKLKTQAFDVSLRMFSFHFHPPLPWDRWPIPPYGLLLVWSQVIKEFANFCLFKSLLSIRHRSLKKMSVTKVPNLCKMFSKIIRIESESIKGPPKVKNSNKEFNQGWILSKRKQCLGLNLKWRKEKRKCPCSFKEFET